MMMRIPLIALAVFGLAVVLVTGFWDAVAAAVLPNTRWGLYSRDFFENVLVEAHGTMIDLLVVGVVLYWFERRHANNESISRYLERLSDLKNYRGVDTSVRTLGVIKRLLALGAKKLPLSEMALNELDIQGLVLVECGLHAAIFSNSRLKHVELKNCDCDAAIFAGAELEHVSLSNSQFRRAKFQNAILKGIDFSTCQLEAADFTNAILRSANFSGVDCKGIQFKNADLRSANFKGARNLTVQMLAAAKSIKYLKSDDAVIQQAVKNAN